MTEDRTYIVFILVLILGFLLGALFIAWFFVPREDKVCPTYEPLKCNNPDTVIFNITKVYQNYTCSVPEVPEVQVTEKPFLFNDNGDTIDPVPAYTPTFYPTPLPTNPIPTCEFPWLCREA